MKISNRFLLSLVCLIVALVLPMLQVQAAEDTITTDQSQSVSKSFCSVYSFAGYEYGKISRTVTAEGLRVYSFGWHEVHNNSFSVQFVTYAFSSSCDIFMSSVPPGKPEITEKLKPQSVTIDGKTVYFVPLDGLLGGYDGDFSSFQYTDVPNLTMYSEQKDLSLIAQGIAEDMARAGYYDYDDSEWATDRPVFRPDTSGAKSFDFSLSDVRITNDIRADWTGISNFLDEDLSNDFVSCELSFTMPSGLTVYKDMGCFVLTDGYISLPYVDLDIDSSYELKSVKLIPFHYVEGDVSGALLKGRPSIRYFDGSFKSPSKYFSSDWLYSEKESINDLGYLQKVTYNIRTENTYPYSLYDVIGWDTSISIPDAYIEMMADIKYRVGASAVTRRLKFLNHYDGIAYSLGHYEFVKEDFFPDYEQVEVQYYYIRLSSYDEENQKYIYGGWVRIDPHNLLSNNINTVVIDSDNKTKIDADSSGSYSYGMGTDGTFDNPINWNDVSFDKFQNISFSWFVDMSTSIVSVLGSFPALINATLGFLPPAFTSILGIFLLACVILRFLGR